MTPISPVFANIASCMGNYNWKKSATDPVELRRAKEIDFMRDMPWMRDTSIQTALSEINDLVFSPEDMRYVKNMGIELPFHSGKECVDFIEKSNIRISFAKPLSLIHI